MNTSSIKKGHDTKETRATIAAQFDEKYAGATFRRKRVNHRVRRPKSKSSTEPFAKMTTAPSSNKTIARKDTKQSARAKSSSASRVIKDQKYADATFRRKRVNHRVRRPKSRSSTEPSAKVTTAPSSNKTIARKDTKQSARAKSSSASRVIKVEKCAGATFRRKEDRRTPLDEGFERAMMQTMMFRNDIDAHTDVRSRDTKRIDAVVCAAADSKTGETKVAYTSIARVSNNSEWVTVPTTADKRRAASRRNSRRIAKERQAIKRRIREENRNRRRAFGSCDSVVIDAGFGDIFEAELAC